MKRKTAKDAVHTITLKIQDRTEKDAMLRQRDRGDVRHAHA